jgi:hypothetical protein
VGKTFSGFGWFMASEPLRSRNRIPDVSRSRHFRLRLGPAGHKVESESSRVESRQHYTGVLIVGFLRLRGNWALLNFLPRRNISTRSGVCQLGDSQSDQLYLLGSGSRRINIFATVAVAKSWQVAVDGAARAWQYRDGHCLILCI